MCRKAEYESISAGYCEILPRPNRKTHERDHLPMKLNGIESIRNLLAICFPDPNAAPLVFVGVFRPQTHQRLKSIQIHLFFWQVLEGAGTTVGPCPTAQVGFGSDSGNLPMNMPLLVVRCQQQLMSLQFL